jgi:hypothetical protein
MSRLRESWGDFPRPPRLTLSRTLSVNIGSYSTGKPAACQAIPPPAGSDRRARLSPSGRPCTRNVPFIGTLPARLAPRRNMAMVQEEPAWAFEHSVDCEVTAEFAWGFWTNVNNWAFDSDIESVEIDGPFAAGARGQCRIVFPLSDIRANSGADAHVRGRPPGRPLLAPTHPHPQKERDDGVPRRPGGLPHLISAGISPLGKLCGIRRAWVHEQQEFRAYRMAHRGSS